MMKKHSAPTHAFRNLLFFALIAVFCGTPFMVANAADLEDLISVCPNDEFEVEWTGPNGPGDIIMISNPDDPPGVRNFDFAETSEGNPVTLKAPNEIGHYKKRYLQADPLAILAEGDLEVIPCGGACSVREYPVDRYAALFHVIQSSSGDRVVEHGPFTVKDLCRAGETIIPIVRDVISRAETPLNVPIAVIDSHVREQLADARDAVCSMNDNLGELSWGTYVYSHCRLAAQSGAFAMDIHLPPGTGDGTMSMADHANRQVMRMTLKRNIHAAAATATGSGWSSGINMNRTGSGSHLGYQTEIYDFDYKMGLGLGSLGELGEGDLDQVSSPLALGNLVSVTVSGSVELAQCIPGINIVTAYHNKLVQELQFDDSSLGAFAGLVKNQVGMLERGMPMDMTSKTAGKIVGIPMVMSTDRNIATGFDIVELPADWCTQTLMPDDYEVIDIDQQINQALSGAGRADAGSGQPGASELNQAMQQMNEAMQQLTPQQREQMNALGLGSMIPGLSDSAPAAPAAPVAARQGPSSDDLYSDNLTQWIQRMLQALGMDPGNTDGESSIETTIAISQFQAEQNMEVTGEVSPQLAGALAAEVDKGGN